MFFSAYIGTDAGLSPWEDALRAHAAWLGLRWKIESRRLGERTYVSFGWLDQKPPDVTRHLKQIGNHLVARTSGDVSSMDYSVRVSDILDGMVHNGHSNDIRIIVPVNNGGLTIVIPPTTPEPFYYTRISQGFVFGDDVRLFRNLMEIELDERAIFGIFQYGAIPPPLTIYRNVHRIPNGHMFELPANLSEPTCTPFFQPTDRLRENGGTFNPEIRVQEALNEVLARTPSSTALYFSGGVDSALLASQLVRLGRTDIQLINYSFGTHDQEGCLARQMAKHLGLKYHQVTHDTGKVSELLNRLGRDYSFPFGDFSTIPTNILVQESLVPGDDPLTVMEGTGADGAFGLAAAYSRWKWIYAVPCPMRRMTDSAYGGLNLWKRNTRTERLARFVRKSVHMSLGHAVVAQNALEGIAYSTPDYIRADLEQAIRTKLEVLSAGAEPKERLSLLDLVWVCAGVMAAKSFDPLRIRGIQPFYPYLEFPMVSLSTSLSWDEKCEAGEAKAPLKKLLARSVPEEWVYRPKSGFTPPYKEIFGSKPFQDFLHDVVLSPRNPLIAFCRIENVTTMIERARHHQSLSIGACDFLWALTFSSGWLDQLPKQGISMKPPNSEGNLINQSILVRRNPESMFLQGFSKTSLTG